MATQKKLNPNIERLKTQLGWDGQKSNTTEESKASNRVAVVSKNIKKENVSIGDISDINSEYLRFSSSHFIVLDDSHLKTLFSGKTVKASLLGVVQTIESTQNIALENERLKTELALSKTQNVK